VGRGFGKILGAKREAPRRTPVLAFGVQFQIAVLEVDGVLGLHLDVPVGQEFQRVVQLLHGLYDRRNVDALFDLKSGE